MATYVLVHGGAHGGWCFKPLARRLRAAGHEVYTPTLTGLGERVHLLREDVDLALHITDIAAVLQYEDLRDVILVGHSYGGMVITGAADRAAGRVSHLVYLDTEVPRHGESLADMTPPGAVEAIRKVGRVVDGIELLLWPGTEFIPNYGVTDADVIAWMNERLTPHPCRCFMQKLELTDESAVDAIPQTQIVTTATLAFRDQSRLAKAKSAGRLWDIDTGHDLMLSEPDAVADLLLRLA